MMPGVPAMPALPDAVLFDNDGLLLDTESVWTRAEEDLFERRERAVGVVRLGGGQELEAHGVEVPDLRRIAPPGRDVRDLERVVVLPDPGRRAEVGDAGLGRDAGAGQHDARLLGADQGR
jgi:hypothetical protein